MDAREIFFGEGAGSEFFGLEGGMELGDGEFFEFEGGGSEGSRWSLRGERRGSAGDESGCGGGSESGLEELTTGRNFSFGEHEGRDCNRGIEENHCATALRDRGE